MRDPAWSVTMSIEPIHRIFGSVEPETGKKQWGFAGRCVTTPPGRRADWRVAAGRASRGELGRVLFGAGVVVYVEDQVVLCGAADAEVERGVLL